MLAQVKNFFVKRKSKAVKRNIAVHPFVVVSMIAAITMVVFIMMFYSLRFFNINL